ncbi:hypothetical protein BG004_006677 [Podila humilis]|nr:hypothetical protein BG004_006677 [Podila humilis]
MMNSNRSNTEGIGGLSSNTDEFNICGSLSAPLIASPPLSPFDDTRPVEFNKHDNVHTTSLSSTSTAPSLSDESGLQEDDMHFSGDLLSQDDFDQDHERDTRATPDAVTSSSEGEIAAETEERAAGDRTRTEVTTAVAQESPISQQQTTSPVRKVSAWSTLLPGVAPIPMAPKPAVARSSNRSTEQRLHELRPIVLPHESEAKLTMEMLDLFEDLLPTEESHERRTKLIQKIENILKTEWPGQDIQAHPFGFLSCDMNINTPLGLMNTKMIKTYVSIDPRVRPFAMIIKHWARRRVLNDAANGGTISTYTWICIVINFLQMRSPPILPALHKMPHTLSPDNQVINGNNTSFCDDLSQLEGFGFANKETLGGLLYAFFRRFAIEFDYDNHVISVREGCYLTKESKGWHIPGKQYKLICVEEPFDTTRNLGNSSDMTSSKGLKEEFRRALDILYQKCSLDLVCAQYVFPPSYYHNSNNNTRKSPNGTLVSRDNSYAGRRYINSYRNNYYYDDLDYDDDDEDDETEPISRELSVMETLNIGTRPPSSKNPISSNNNNHQNNQDFKSRESSSNSRNTQSKENSSSARPKGDQNSRGQARNSTRNQKDGGSTESTSNAKSGSRSLSSSKNEKSGSTGSSSSSSARKSRNKGSGSGDGQKSGGGGGGRSGGSGNGGGNGSSGRPSRSAVEFSLADIATVAPKILSAAKKAEQAAQRSETNGDSTSGSGAGDESLSKGRRKGRKNVVWSTNSNRGETAHRQGGIKVIAGTTEPSEKAKVIFVEEELSSEGSLTPRPPSITCVAEI